MSPDQPRLMLWWFRKAGASFRETTGPRTYLTGRAGLIEGNQRSITEFKDLLARILERPVEDHTGLIGKYDLKLEWNPVELVNSRFTSE